MSRKQDSYYYDSFVMLSDYFCQGAIFLETTLREFDPNTLSARIEELHRIEHAADMSKHEVMKKLVREFITPIEREDIMLILQRIDDVTDALEDVLRRMYMYNLTSVPKDAVTFAAIIRECCEATKCLLQEFHDFKRSKMLREHLITINTKEEEGDKLHLEVIRRLGVAGDPLYIMRWSRMYDGLEKCCDACEDVSDAIESVIMKNT
ncbi:MAG: DUF47 family protein [Clostridia bacterium]